MATDDLTKEVADVARTWVASSTPTASRQRPRRAGGPGAARLGRIVRCRRRRSRKRARSLTGLERQTLGHPPGCGTARSSNGNALHTELAARIAQKAAGWTLVALCSTAPSPPEHRSYPHREVDRFERVKLLRQIRAHLGLLSEDTVWVTTGELGFSRCPMG